MSTTSAVAEQHGEHGAEHGHDHDHDKPHITPLAHYIAVWAALLVLTVVTVGVSYFDFGQVNLLIAMAVATVKATLVGLIFMHLLYDNKFHGFVFASSLLFLGIFIAFTMFDTEKRNRIDSIQGERPADIDNPFAGTVRDEERKNAWKNGGGEGEGKSEAKPEAKAEGKAESKPEGEAKPAEAKPEEKAEAKPTPAPAAPVEAKPEHK